MFYGETKHATHLWGRHEEGGGGGFAGVFTQEGAPGRWAGRQAFDTSLTTRDLRGWQPVLHAAWEVIVSHREDGLQVMQLLFLTWGVPSGLSAPFQFLFPHISLPLWCSFHSEFYSKMSYLSFKKEVTPSQAFRRTEFISVLTIDYHWCSLLEFEFLCKVNLYHYE